MLHLQSLLRPNGEGNAVACDGRWHIKPIVFAILVADKPAVAHAAWGMEKRTSRWYDSASRHLCVRGVLRARHLRWAGRIMTIAIRVPAVLRACCDGATELNLAAASVRAALEQLERSHPTLYRSVCDETGAVRRHINLFVNHDHMRDREGLDTALVAGDVLTILPAVSGG